jgi:hypothetical protein
MVHSEQTLEPTFRLCAPDVFPKFVVVFQQVSYDVPKYIPKLPRVPKVISNKTTVYPMCLAQSPYTGKLGQSHYHRLSQVLNSITLYPISLAQNSTCKSKVNG